jgi:hypothetical protein
MRKLRLKKVRRLIICIILLAAIAGGTVYVVSGSDFQGLVFFVKNIVSLEFIQKPYFTAKDFKISTVHSTVDFNKNGVDDYTDIMLGARKDAIKHPKYKSAYYAGGYPPETEGVCTDVVWRAFRNAGYSLRDMLDLDIRENTDIYLRDGEIPDSNIDFRRVPNLKLYFERKATSLTLDTSNIAQFQPGDIVTYGTGHIAMISDRRNKEGVPYIIHNTGQQNREEDGLNRSEISGHFRFDASKMKKADLIKFP